jgi:FkbM family methyltransferase
MTRDLTRDFWIELATLLRPVGAMVLDVGAHLLEEAQQLLPMIADAYWHAFEPNPECYHTCSNSIVPYLRPKCREIRLTCSAVGASPGQTDLYLSAKRSGEPWTASSSTRAPKNVLAAYPWLTFPKKISVPVTTLDTYCRELGFERIDLVKMDVQGAEADVVRGGQETFAKTKYLLTEVVENEEYDGQLDLAALTALLPGTWELVERTTCDALLRNTSTKETR